MPEAVARLTPMPSCKLEMRQQNLQLWRLAKPGSWDYYEVADSILISPLLPRLTVTCSHASDLGKSARLQSGAST